MAKIILAVGVLASVTLGIVLWKGVTRVDSPEQGKWSKVTAEFNEPKLPWKLLRVGDEFRMQARGIRLPLLGTAVTQVQVEVLRRGETYHFGDPPAWRFWGILGLVAAAPLGLSALAVIALSLLPRRRAAY